MCCLEFALALLLALSVPQLRAECAAISCQQQPNADCMSAYGALQVAQYLGIPAHSLDRWDWGAVDAAVWTGFVYFGYLYADSNWTPDGIAHAYFCLGDKWLDSINLRIMHCWSVDEPGGIWLSVPFMQSRWTGWAVVR